MGDKTGIELGYATIALSIRQPWAWLIVNGWKPVENRTWWTGRRGKFSVHAGKKFDREGYEWVRETFPNIPIPEAFERGGIVGEATIAGCVTTMENEWFFGPYGFVLQDAAPVPFRPCRGALGFFRIKDEGSLL